MRYRASYARAPIQIFAVLALLLSASPIVNPVNSSLQRESVVSNHGTILAQDSFTEGIFFQYGGETGDLQPPWDFVGPNGDGIESGSKISIAEAPVRTGTKAVRIYQVPPPKSDAQRRVGLKYWSHTQTDFYFSWWAYFPTGYDNIVDGAEWLTFGGLTLYWGNPDTDPSGKFSKGLRLRFFAGKDSNGFYAYLSWSGFDSTEFWEDYPFYWWIENREYLALNQWHNFQVYIKVDTNAGVVRGWINNVLVGELVDTPTHPSFWGEPEPGDQYGRNSDKYTLIVEQYCDESTPELEMFIDDFIGSTEKVSNDYIVVGS